MANRPRLAAIITEYRKHSHGQHIVDRLTEGYGWNGDHYHPPMDVVALYVDQRPQGDLTDDRIKRFPQMKLYPTIAEAVTCGTSKLAVDGVVIVGEHGTYKRTEKGQTQYPRYEFFQQVVKVYKDSGRSVPMFNDKHLSWNWDWAKEMYDTSKQMGFPYMAGSSLAVTWRTPSLEMPHGARIRESMCVGYGGMDSYDFHALETDQCMTERRRGGEGGVKWLQAYRGDKFYQALAEGIISKDLMFACLCRSHTLTPAREGFSDILPTVDDMKRISKEPIAYVYEHEDGVKSTMILFNGLVRDFNYAARLEAPSRIFSTQMYLPMPDGRTTAANFFSPLVNNFEKMFLTGKATYPVERTLLTTGLVNAGVESIYRNQARYETPHLKVRYQVPNESYFWRS